MNALPSPAGISPHASLPAADVSHGRRDPFKADRARDLLAEQRAGLEYALGVFCANRLELFNRNSARRRLADVIRHQHDMNRDPEFFAPLVLGFQGENGWAPLIRTLISDAHRIAEKGVS